MRPVLPADQRAHPAYTIDFNDGNLQNALAELLYNAQEQATVEKAIQDLRDQGAVIPRNRPAGFFRNFSNNDRERLGELRDAIGQVLGGNADKNYKIIYLDEMRRLYGEIRKSHQALVGQYTNAHNDLIASLGYYCSYCGMPVGVSVHVEHKLPKVDYPNRALRWNNLLLACTSCNASKGEQPARLTGAPLASPPWPVPLPPLGAPLPAATEDQIANGSYSTYLWVDDPTYVGIGDFTFRLIRVAYDPVFAVRTFESEIIPADLEVLVRNGQVRRLPPYAEKIVVGQFGPDTWEVELHVAAVSRDSTNPQEQAKENAAKAVINGLHFNRDQGDLRRAEVSDLRVPLRTDAWFKAVSGLYRLIRAYLRDGGQFGPGYQDLEDVWLESAVSSGFWLVWVQVIRTYVANDTLRTRLLRRFIDQSLFPGTRSTAATS